MICYPKRSQVQNFGGKNMVAAWEELLRPALCQLQQCVMTEFYMEHEGGAEHTPSAAA